MKPFIILGLLIIFPLLHSCGMFGGAEPEITKEEPAVTDSSGSDTQENSEANAEEIETLKDEEYRKEIEAKEDKIEEILAEKDGSENEEMEELSDEKSQTEEPTTETDTIEQQTSENESSGGFIFARLLFYCISFGGGLFCLRFFIGKFFHFLIFRTVLFCKNFLYFIFLCLNFFSIFFIFKSFDFLGISFRIFLCI